MENGKHQHAANTLVALALILIGVLFLLNNFDVLDLGGLWRFWPLLLIFIGVQKLTSTEHRRGGSGPLLIGLGIVFLLTNLHIADWDTIWRFWPVALIVIGISIILRRRKMFDAGQKAEALSDDRIDVVAIFGGHERKILSDNFQGGTVTSIFGGSKLDFRQTKLSGGKNVLDVLALFGGTELLVPDDWRIVLKGFPLFGGFEDSRHLVAGPDAPNDKTLVVTGLAMFGGLHIKSA